MRIPTDHHIKRLMIHTFSHAAVDFACFYILFARVAQAQSGRTAPVAFLVYNLIAFGLQPLFGFVIDYFRSFPAASIGCLLVLVGVCLPQSAALVGLVFAALGNAWFHVGAGSDTLLASHGRMWDSGMFVSSGALGVALGTLAGQAQCSPAIPILLVAIPLLLEWWLPTQYGGLLERYWIYSGKTSVPVTFLLLLFAIAIRSFVGAAVPLPWKVGNLDLLLAAVAAFVGKAFGGLLADLFGARRIGTGALLLSLPLLCFGQQSAVLSLIGIALFNIPMSITLCALADLLPLNTGLAFGLSTLALLVGMLPALLLPLGEISTVLLLLPVLVAALFLSIAVRDGRNMLHETI